MIPDKAKREFWTNGNKWDKYRDVILETFDLNRIAYNDHTSPEGKHQPLLVAIKDVIKDKERALKNNEDAWAQYRTVSVQLQQKSRLGNLSNLNFGLK